ncbi:MAG: glycoside-pentoside-hexuronide (GPH):cation symporter [Clostridium sp.]|nr:glycoside-pentoside-hexuronide (GPH):cation symporter [Clostridium sp.]
MNQTSYIPNKEKWAFSIGALGQGMIYAMMSSYISDYYLNVLQLAPMFVLFLMLFARLWDAINDPMMGMIVDRRTTKRGKMRPYIIYASIPIGVLTILMYLSPNLNKGPLMIFSAVVYVLWGMLYTMADVPFWSLPNVMTPNAEERSSAISFSRILNGIGSAVPEVLFLVIGLILPRILGASDGLEYNKTKYLIMAIITVAIGLVLYSNTYFHVKERVVIPDVKPIKGEPSRLSRIFKCKPLMLVILMGVLSSGRYMVQAAAVHVARYTFYIGEPLEGMSDTARVAAIEASVSTVKTIFQACAIVGMFGAMLFMPLLMKKFDYKKIVITTCLAGFAASIFTTLIGWFTMNLYICIPFIVISCIPLGVLNVVSYAMICDCLDYMELKTGFRDNALGSACQGFVNKLGNALATSGIVVMYMCIGLEPEKMLSSDVIMAATDLAMNQRFAMFSLVSIVPGISLLLCAIPMFFYKISGKEKERIETELAEQRKIRGIAIEN